MDDDMNETCVSVSITRKQQQRWIGVVSCQRQYSSQQTSLQSTQLNDIITLPNQLSNVPSIRYCIEFIEFLDNEQYSNLDSLLIQLNVKKVFISDEYEEIKGESKKIYNILQRKDIKVVYMKKALFQMKHDTTAKLQKLNSNNNSHSNSNMFTTIDKERPYAVLAIEPLLHGLQLMNDDDLYGCYDMKYSGLSMYLRLDSAAAEAINLLPKPDHPSQYGSLYGILNKCKTKMGSRLLERWLRQPLIDHNEINQRLDIVEVLKYYVSYRTQLTNEILKSIPDLDTVVLRMQRKNAGLAEIYKLYLFSKTLPKIISILTSMQNEAEEDIVTQTRVFYDKLGTSFVSLQEKFQLYEELVEHVIDMNRLPDLMINPVYDNELQELKEEEDHIDMKIDTLWKQARDTWCSGIDVKLEDSLVHRGIIFRSTKADDERQIRANNKSVTILSILKNGVHFTIPQLEKLSDRKKEIQALYKEKQSALSSKVIETALSYLPVAEIATGLIAELDVLNAFANVAAMSSNTYIRPRILPMGTGIIKLQGARHPCVELMNDMNFIANDYDLVHNESNYQIITGPNMGGKSTYIRGLGSIIVLAQVGCYVPCESGAISVVDCILARVGAGDAVQKGVSTFMAEMLEASTILQTATKNSVLIIDELGRGTSTFDGYGLAYAISQYIISNINSYTLFATHFHELTDLDKHYANVRNKHVSAMIDSSGGSGSDGVVMLYTLEPGPCQQSYGINIAKAAGFPKEVISEAKRKAYILERLQEIDVNDMKRQKIVSSMEQFAAIDMLTASKEDLISTLKPLFPSYPLESI